MGLSAFLNVNGYDFPCPRVGFSYTISTTVNAGRNANAAAIGQRGRYIAMTNEQIVTEIRNGYSVTDNMQLLYESNLPLIKKFIKPFANYGELEDMLQESYFGLWEAVQHYETSASDIVNIG